MNYVLKMLSQPSSYAGLAAGALALGVSQPAFVVYTTAAAALFGLIAFFVDGKPDQ
jgi:hypothetical protein